MKADTQIAPPKNWSDFETLCMKLWGEIWNCPDTIIKNGRSGQSQKGVDVCGAPNDGFEYYGIQCKGKDKYIHAQLTTKEIDGEIEKAKNFIPPLKQFIFATTAVKDANIEEYIRLKNIESQQQGGFTIHLFSWEDIVEKLKERRNTYNWYMNDCQYIDNSNVSIEIIGQNFKLNPKLYSTLTKYELHPYRHDKNMKDLFNMRQKGYSMFDIHTVMNGISKINYGWCDVKIRINNIGSTVLSDYHLLICFAEGVKDFSTKVSYYNERFIDQAAQAILNKQIDDEREVFISDEFGRTIEFRPKNTKLVQGEPKSFKVGILPKIGVSKIKLIWVFLSNGYKKKGEIEVEIEPQIEENEKVIYVDSENELKPETTVLEYKIIEK